VSCCEFLGLEHCHAARQRSAQVTQVINGNKQGAAAAAMYLPQFIQ